MFSPLTVTRVPHVPPQYFPDGNCIVTGSDDCSCKMYDLRSDQELMSYQDASLNAGVTSLALSSSGRLIFAGYDDFNCHIWDSLKGEKVGERGNLGQRSQMRPQAKNSRGPKKTR